MHRLAVYTAFPLAATPSCRRADASSPNSFGRILVFGPASLRIAPHRQTGAIKMVSPDIIDLHSSSRPGAPPCAPRRPPSPACRHLQPLLH
eukprot:3810057-Prymnesium_polylepis.1